MKKIRTKIAEHVYRMQFILIFAIFLGGCGASVQVTNPLSIELGDDQRVSIGEIVELEALISNAEDVLGKISWEFISTPVNSRLVDLDIQKTSAKFLPDIVGRYLIRVKIKGEDSIQREDTISVIVIASSLLDLLEISYVGDLITREDGGPTSFSLSLKTIPTSDVLVQLSTSNNAEGSLSLSEVTFTSSNWDKEVFVEITGVDDSLLDGDISYLITISASSSDEVFQFSGSESLKAINIDNDILRINILSEDSLRTSEEGGVELIRVTLNTQPMNDVSILISTTNLEEAIVSPQSINFDKSNWNVTQTVSITGVDDNILDGDVSYRISFDSSTSLDSGYSSIGVRILEAVNIDNETAGLLLVGAENIIIYESGEAHSISVSLASAPTSNVRVAFRASIPSEVDLSPEDPLTFTPANWNIPQNILIEARDDDSIDGDIALDILFDPLTSNDPNYNELAISPISVMSQDNDSPNIILTNTAELITTEAGGESIFSLSLTTIPSSEVKIIITSSDTSEGIVVSNIVVSNNEIIFNELNWNEVQDISAKGVDDFIDDDDSMYQLDFVVQTQDENYANVSIPPLLIKNTDDDSAGVTLGNDEEITTNESGTEATFDVTLTSMPTANVSLRLISSNDTEATVLNSILAFTPDNWNVAQTVRVRGNNDSIDDGDMSYFIYAQDIESTDEKYNDLTTTDVLGVNIDDDSLGIVVEPGSGILTTVEGGQAEFSIALSSEPTDDVVINITSNNTAEGVVSQGEITFTSINWESPQAITVSGVDDNIDDGNKNYEIQFVVSSSDGQYNNFSITSLALQNIDNDSVGISISKAVATTSESGSSDSIGIALESAPLSQVEITLTSSNITEGTLSVVGPIIFDSNNWNVNQNIIITGVDDFIDDGDRAFEVTGSVISSDLSYHNFNFSPISVTNTDDDDTSLLIDFDGELITTESGGTDSFSVRLSSQPTAQISLNIVSSNSGEGSVNNSSLAFNENNWNTEQNITITGIDDALLDGNIAFNVTLSVTAGDTSYLALEPVLLAVTNNDNDNAAGISVASNPPLITSEEGGEATFSLTLLSQPTGDVTINVASNNTAEGIVSQGAITFTSINWESPQTITVSGVDDDVVDGDKSYEIQFVVSSSDGQYNNFSITSLALQNVDNDSVGISVSKAAATISESGSSDSIGIALESAPLSQVEITLTSSNIAEGTLSVVGPIIFDSNNWNVNQNIIITGVDDFIDDGDRAFEITGSVVSSDLSYHNFNFSPISVTNTDDDDTSLLVNFDGELITTESGGTDSFSVRLSSQPTAQVSLSIVSSNLDEGIISNSSLAFNENNWNTEQNITITGIDDALSDGNITFNVTLSVTSDDASYSALGPVLLTVTNNDNEPSSVVYGLDQRPVNESCLAPARPASEASIELERVFSDLTFTGALGIAQAPNNSDRWYVVEKAGIIKTFLSNDPVTTNFISIVDRVDSNAPALWAETGLLGFAFHPEFGASNYKVYLSYTAPGAVSLESRISEFTSNDLGTNIDLESERILLKIDQPGPVHNGGNIAFGPDGYLYIGMGDGGGSSAENGQNTQSLHGAMLRIDVNVDEGELYAIPPSNPFASSTSCADSACPEIYAWGLRNPWRWSFDSETGALWLGDVGQFTSEEVNQIKLGGNYGWSTQEGFCVPPEGGQCSGSLIDPVVTYATGVEGVAITGGYVYRGELIPELKGVYIYGDYAFGTIWGLFYNDDGTPNPTVLASSTEIYLSSFGEALDGELYLTDLGGGISKLVRASGPSDSTFPIKLSDTGCMDVSDVTLPGPALIPYNVNTPLWTDGATKQRWLALPNDSTITIDPADNNNWEFPIGTVFVKHFTIEDQLAETRTLIRHEDGGWAGYSYEWDEDGLDATLVTGGKVKTIQGIDWVYPSSAQCMLCHTQAVGSTIGPETLQLNREYVYPNGRTANQLLTFEHIGLFDAPLPDLVVNLPRLPPMADLSYDLESRARGYLHANCAYCHLPGGVGRGSANLHYLTPVESMGLCDIDPFVGDMGVDAAKLISAGDPDTSILSLRMHALDVYRMPPLGTSLVHSEGSLLIDDWIETILVCP